MNTLTNEIIYYLKKNPDQMFTAKELAVYITSTFEKELEEKSKKYKTKKDFIQQISAEIGSQKKTIQKREPKIEIIDKPRPRKFFYSTNKKTSNLFDNENIKKEKNKISEHSLYPLLIEYLSKTLNLYSLRIDEKKSRNINGKDGNVWLHPDIVSMEAVDENWDQLIKECVESSNAQRVKLYSFEVKLDLTLSTVRKSFFQAVSNSSWANEGYLVTTGFKDPKVEKELRMLSSLHGIGVIILNTETPEKSEIFLPAKTKNDVDWESVDRILTLNSDFKNYIDLVVNYYKTKRIRKADWNK